MEAAQQRQISEYRKWQGKGVKTFNIYVGQKVLQRNSRNDSRKGGKMEPKWTGPYKYVVLEEPRLTPTVICIGNFTYVMSHFNLQSP